MTLLCCFATSAIMAQDVSVTVNATVNKKKVSPYIYGRNNTFDKPAQFYKDAGLRFSRMNGGNNATKYNWRKKLTSHPDWYNNVYDTDWDKSAKEVSTTYPYMQQMYAFQLIGRVASSKSYNFKDWDYNQSSYWFGVGQNLAGGGIANTTDEKNGSTALKEGDINLYTEEWPADSTVAILNHWFGANGLKLNKSPFLYWNMDNESDVWNGTHSDVMKTLISAPAYMDNYINIAKKARALFPEIKFCGPVTTSEWQWYKWADESIRIDGKYYSWLEYFIKRCADEEKASGIRVLDVVDLHNYPWAKNGDIDALQLHRMYYDTDYTYAGANGLYTLNGGWDTSLNKEYIFKRINDWLTNYYGENNGITCAISEWSPASSESNPSVTSVVYASHLGTFANNGVEFFTPWTWMNGMWETLHLFSRYAKNNSVSSISSLENTVSAYTTVSEVADSMTVMIVNRDMSSARKVTVNLNGFSVNNGNYSTLQLSALPSSETFVSHTNNALKLNSVTINSNSFSITVPSLSTTAVILKSTLTGIAEHKNQTDELKIYPNPATDILNVSISSNVAEPTEIDVFDLSGRKIQVSEINYDGYSPITTNVSTLSNGFYLLSVKNKHFTSTKRFFVEK
ncbi:MAG: T9SS type A sorting domain-containing protein [Paludibacter sp.]|nr:T9SS type A sorting domain-containing protein [Paludibacter sp.]